MNKRENGEEREMRLFGERRRHKRYRINLDTPYAVTRLRESIEGKGIIRNISYGGLKLDISKKLQKKAHFIIPIIAQKLDIYVTVAGKIIWVKYNDVASCGIKLEWFSDKDVYKKYIEILESADKIY